MKCLYPPPLLVAERDRPPQRLLIAACIKRLSFAPQRGSSRDPIFEPLDGIPGSV
jgi:hypothetical protein